MGPSTRGTLPLTPSDAATQAPASDLASRLDRVVLYQIYPQSYADTNGDGIGDLPGITARLDYLHWLGIDAIWISPCFVSPFADAGYDVADYCRIAPRYGTNDDMRELVEGAAQRNIAVLLDLVAGHTSDTHPWFQAAMDDWADDRYIWSDRPGEGMVACPGTRGGYYKQNFFACQPALNYGYARMDPDEPWRSPVDAPGPQANREALRQIMAFWFDLGVAGFRVDMASSLVKDDPGFVETGKLWNEMRQWIDETYPGRVIVAEWGDPATSVPAGFHADFFLQFGGSDSGLALRSLWNNGSGTVEDIWGEVPCWADARGLGSGATFVAAWRTATDAIAAAGRGGVIGLPTANHDFTRLVSGTRDSKQAAAAFVLALTWPAMPSVYYGDEIGMRYLTDVPTKEGSRLSPIYERAGSRTPMQWGALPAGTFGPSVEESQYLPQDPDPNRPTVAAQWNNSRSLLTLVRELISLRHTDRRLDIGASVDVLATEYPFAFVRGGSLLVAINPSDREVVLDLSAPIADGDDPLPAGRVVVLGSGADVGAAQVTLAPFGFAVVDLAG